MPEKLPYQLGAQFVLAVDMVYPWAAFSALNNHDLFEKDSSANTLWIILVGCTALTWTLVSIVALLLSCSCKKTPRRIDLMLRAWIVASSIGVLIHVVSNSISHTWILVVFSLILRLPYLYMIIVYWSQIRYICQHNAHSPSQPLTF